MNKDPDKNARNCVQFVYPINDHFLSYWDKFKLVRVPLNLPFHKEFIFITLKLKAMRLIWAGMLNFLENSFSKMSISWFCYVDNPIIYPMVHNVERLGLAITLRVEFMRLFWKIKNPIFANFDKFCTKIATRYQKNPRNINFYSTKQKITNKPYFTISTLGVLAWKNMSI